MHRTYLEQQAEEKRIADRKMNEIYGPLRGLQLKTYVNSIRQNLFNERINEKKQRFTEALQKYAIFLKAFLFSYFIDVPILDSKNRRKSYTRLACRLWSEIIRGSSYSWTC